MLSTSVVVVLIALRTCCGYGIPDMDVATLVEGLVVGTGVDMLSASVVGFILIAFRTCCGYGIPDMDVAPLVKGLVV